MCGLCTPQDSISVFRCVGCVELKMLVFELYLLDVCQGISEFELRIICKIGHMNGNGVLEIKEYVSNLGVLIV